MDLVFICRGEGGGGGGGGGDSNLDGLMFTPAAGVVLPVGDFIPQHHTWEIVYHQQRGGGGGGGGGGSIPPAPHRGTGIHCTARMYCGGRRCL